jgi:hypothetical protein
MKRSGARFPLFGILLIALGGVLLLSRFTFIHVSFWKVFWPVIMVVSLVGVGYGFSEQRRGKIFWNTLWFLFSLMLFLSTSGLFDMHPRMFFPGTFLIIGIAFLMTFINNIRDWFFLLPAVIFGGLGVLFILADLEMVSYWDVSEAVRRYWPLILIVCGVAILLKRRPRSVAQPPGL